MELSFQFKSQRNGIYQPNSRISVGLKIEQQYLFLKFLGALDSFCRDKEVSPEKF